MAGEHLAELGVDGAGVELAGRRGHVERPVGERERAVVDDEPGALAQVGAELDLAGLVGAEGRDVHPGATSLSSRMATRLVVTEMMTSAP